MHRPKEGTVPPYYYGYIRALPDRPMLDVLKAEHDTTLELLGGLDPQVWKFRYAPEKWSVKELVGHLADTERVFALRGLWWARSDPQEQPGFSENDWMRAAQLDSLEPASILEYFETSAAATHALYATLNPAELQRRGGANGVQMACGDVPWILAGHARHHRQVLIERYLNAD